MTDTVIVLYGYYFTIKGNSCKAVVAKYFHRHKILLAKKTKGKSPMKIILIRPPKLLVPLIKKIFSIN